MEVTREVMTREEMNAEDLGKDIVALFRLNEIGKTGRYETFTGDKTLIGLGRTVRRLTFKY